MRKSIGLLSILLAAILIYSPVAMAQQASVSGEWDTVRAVPPGEELTIKVKEGRTQQGKVTEVTDGGVDSSARQQVTNLCARRHLTDLTLEEKGREGKVCANWSWCWCSGGSSTGRMLGDVNSHLKKIEPSGDQRVNMWCHTCHHGRPRPMTLEEELGEQYRMKGLDTALTHYQDLKKNYLEKGAYDFSERSLNTFGYEILGKKDTAGATRIFMLNAQVFPKSPNVWDSLAEAYMKAGDTKMAKRYYEKALRLDPKNEGARENLKKIREAARKSFRPLT